MLNTSSNIDNNDSAKPPRTRINDVILRKVNMSSLNLFNINATDSLGNRVTQHSLIDQEVSTDNVPQQEAYTETEL